MGVVSEFAAQNISIDFNTVLRHRHICATDDFGRHIQGAKLFRDDFSIPSGFFAGIQVGPHDNRVNVAVAGAHKADYVKSAAN